MSATETKDQKTSNSTVVKKLRDYSNDPFFKEKAEKAKAFIEKNGLPKSFSKDMPA